MHGGLGGGPRLGSSRADSSVSTRSIVASGSVAPGPAAWCRRCRTRRGRRPGRPGGPPPYPGARGRARPSAGPRPAGRAARRGAGPGRRRAARRSPGAAGRGCRRRSPGAAGRRCAGRPGGRPRTGRAPRPAGPSTTAWSPGGCAAPPDRCRRACRRPGRHSRAPRRPVPSGTARWRAPPGPPRSPPSAGVDGRSPTTAAGVVRRRRGLLRREPRGPGRARWSRARRCGRCAGPGPPPPRRAACPGRGRTGPPPARAPPERGDPASPHRSPCRSPPSDRLHARRASPFTVDYPGIRTSLDPS